MARPIMRDVVGKEGTFVKAFHHTGYIKQYVRNNQHGRIGFTEFRSSHAFEPALASGGDDNGVETECEDYVKDNSKRKCHDFLMDNR